MTRLEFERRRRRWNQTELAFRARTTQGRVSGIERRRIKPPTDLLARLGLALSLPPEALLEEV